jgi:hypothetical protein
MSRRSRSRADKLVSGSGGSAPSGFVRGGGALFLVGEVELRHQVKGALHPLLRLPRRGNAGDRIAALAAPGRLAKLMRRIIHLTIAAAEISTLKRRAKTEQLR